jgi:hypothetical protein
MSEVNLASAEHPNGGFVAMNFGPSAISRVSAKRRTAAREQRAVRRHISRKPVAFFAW